jgi:hypothetical protein
MKSFLLFLALLLIPAASAAAPPAPEALSFFENRVRPVLVNQCFNCHGPKKSMAGLRLDSREGLLKGADSGKVIEPGDPAKSLLIQAIKHDGDVKMPPKKRV